MKIKKAVVFTLSMLVLFTSFGAANVLQNYSAFYLRDVSFGVWAGLALFVLCIYMLLLSVDKHSRWKRYLPFWVGLALLGVFAPYNHLTTGVLVWPTIGAMPLMLVAAIWILKGFWAVES
ncbi:hypothetical protein ACEOHC_003871 [Salmonella enterica]